MKLLGFVALIVVSIAHDQPLDTVHTVDTVDTGVLRFLIKGPCSPQILAEFNDLAVICNRYSRHPALGMKWATDKWDVSPGTSATPDTRPFLPTDDTESDATVKAYYDVAEVKHIRLNHVTVAIECCDALLNSSPAGTPGTGSTAATTLGAGTLANPTVDGVEAGYGWYPCHDLMRSLFNSNDLPTSQELYAGGLLTNAATSNPDPDVNTASGTTRL